MISTCTFHTKKTLITKQNFKNILGVFSQLHSMWHVPLKFGTHDNWGDEHVYSYSIEYGNVSVTQCNQQCSSDQPYGIECLFFSRGDDVFQVSILSHCTLENNTEETDLVCFFWEEDHMVNPERCLKVIVCTSTKAVIQVPDSCRQWCDRVVCTLRMSFGNILSFLTNSNVSID